MRAKLQLPLLAALLLAAGPVPAHEAPIDHVDRTLRVEAKGETLHLHYRLHHTPRSVIMQMRAMDTDRNGSISEDERTRYFTGFAAELARSLVLRPAGKETVSFHPTGDVTLRPDLSSEFGFAATLGGLATGTHHFVLTDKSSRKYPGRLKIKTAPLDRKKPVLVEVKESKQTEQAQGHPSGIVLDVEITVF